MHPASAPTANGDGKKMHSIWSHLTYRSAYGLVVAIHPRVCILEGVVGRTIAVAAIGTIAEVICNETTIEYRRNAKAHQAP
mmetsp:Transcript_92672/g.183946  ORF Transcript_92672/g.183946 Transcript_92672/m.183946 type:complete len:81 (+) Transcript_92672:183-425(+)